MKTFVKITFEKTHKENGHISLDTRYMQTKAMPKNYPKAIERGKKEAEAILAKEANNTLYDYSLKEIKIVDGLNG